MWVNLYFVLSNYAKLYIQLKHTDQLAGRCVLYYKGRVLDYTGRDELLTSAAAGLSNCFVVHQPRRVSLGFRDAGAGRHLLSDRLSVNLLTFRGFARFDDGKFWQPRGAQVFLCSCANWKRKRLMARERTGGGAVVELILHTDRCWLIVGVKPGTW